jgi:hypothetical protein
MLRNPIDRAYLNWAHMYFKSGRPRQHPDTDSGDPIDILPNPPRGPLFRLPMEIVGHPNGWTWCRMWLEPGLYAAQLQRIRRLVPLRLGGDQDARQQPLSIVAAFAEDTFHLLIRQILR